MNTNPSVQVVPSPQHSPSSASGLGLMLALCGPVLYSFVARPRLLKSLVDPITYGMLGLLVMWFLTGAVVLIVLRWERMPLTALGVRPLSWRTTVLGVSIGLGCSVAVPILTQLARLMLPDRPGGTIGEVTTALPPWMIFFAILTAACTEEVLFRAYPIEQMQAWTGRNWPGALVALLFFVAQHLGTWNPSHVIGVVLRLGVVLTGVYLWRRNLVFVVLIHFMTDFPLFLIAAGLLPQIA